jgi:hypothetical protein
MQDALTKKDSALAVVTSLKSAVGIWPDIEINVEKGVYIYRW